MSVQNLAREFVAQPRWRWVAGMRGITTTGDGFRIIAVDDERMFYIFDDGYTHPTKAHERTLALVKADRWLPDLHDGGTVGAIEFGLLRELKGAGSDPDADPINVIAEPLLLDLKRYNEPR